MKQFLKKGKAEGSVLFTVISVMLVLVVFLMSTMVLTSSANRRSYYSYFETQAQYAAQAALDAVTASAYTDSGFYEWVKRETAAKVGQPLANQPKVTVNFGTEAHDPSNGTASEIQFTGGNSSVECTIEQTGRNIMVWDDVTKAVHEQTAYKITATASVGNGRNRADYTVVNYIYENFRVPDGAEIPSWANNASNTITNWNRSGTPSDPGEGGSILQAVWSLGMADTSNNMTYFGPQYSGMASIPVGRMKYDEAGQNLNKANDNYAVGNAVYVGNYNVVISYMMNFTFERFGESAQFWGNLQYDGAAKAAGGDGKDQGFFFNSKISEDEVSAAKAAYGNPIPYTALPYVYVDGVIRLTSNGGMYFGLNEKPANNKGSRNSDFYNVNVFCGGIQTGNETGAEFSVAGDIYMYDQSIDSNIKGVRGYTTLAKFTSDNIDKANTQWDDMTVGGNIICNNKSLTLNAQTNEPNLYIEGDLIFTNPAGTLDIVQPVDFSTSSKVLCAGTLTEGSLAKLNCDTIVTRTYAKVDGVEIDVTNGDDDYIKEDDNGNEYFDYNDFLFSEYGDGAYDSHVTIDMDTYNATGYSLMPYSFRIDEIFDEYLRWDLQDLNIDMAAEKAANDPYIQESKNAGHSWGPSNNVYQMKEFDGEDIYVWDDARIEKQEVIWWDCNSYEFGNSGLETVSWSDEGPFFDENGGQHWSKGVYLMEVTVGTTGHWDDGITYVPYTKPVTENSFIKHFEPIVDETALKTMIDPKYFIDSITEFTSDMTGAPTYENKQQGTHADVTVVYHKNDQNYANEKDAVATKTLKNAMIITDSCTIDVSNDGNIPVFIDPYAKSHTDSSPLKVVLKGNNARGNIIINNTAIYSGSNYGAYSTLASTGNYASRRQVYIFFADGFEANASPGFRIFMSGTYGYSGEPDVYPSANGGQTSPGNYNVVSNPIYPNSTLWDDLDGSVKYAYELVPNTVIFAERNANIKFNNAGFLNAEILMPTSYMSHPNASLYSAKIDYKEEYYSLSYNTSQTAQGDNGLPCIGIGSVLCKGITTGSNTSCMVYIGDTHRGGGEASIVYEPEGGNNPNTAKLGGDNQDFFNNDHMGAS